MKARLLWLAAAPAALVAPAAVAKTYLSLEQAQALMFPGVTLEAAAHPLSDAEAAAIQRASGVQVTSRLLKAWKAGNGGWFLLDQVVGKHELITYALALGADGAVKGVEILDYRESYGDEVRSPAWRAQFVGKRANARLELNQDIRNISGATLSCRHVTEGIRRLMATYALVLAPPVR
jgi:Na+-translocating ferredoxin:NAD+ oxidoreductase RnfG subunit